MGRGPDTEKMEVLLEKLWIEYKSRREKPDVDEFIEMLKLVVFVHKGQTAVIQHTRLHKGQYGTYADFGLVENGFLKYLCFYKQETDAWGCKYW